MSTTLERTSNSFEAQAPDIELAGSLQAVLKGLDTRAFNLGFQQQEALEAIGHALLDGQRTGYVEMATSTGKTAVEALLAEASVKAGRRVLMLAPSIPVCRQIIGVDSKNSTGLAKFAHVPNSVSVGPHFDGSIGTASDEIVVSTYAGFLNDTSRGHAQLGEFDVVIADECHRSLGIKTSTALKEAFPDAVKIGFSATPDYAIDRRSEEVYATSLYEFSLREAIENGHTAPINALLYETNDRIKVDTNRRDFSDAELAPLINLPERNGTAASLTEAFVREGRKGIVACIPGSHNLHARLMAELLNSRGIRAAAVGAHLSPSKQAEIIAQYERGVHDVLTFTRSLEEGWDSATTSFVINMAPTTSPVRTTQLLGRALRPKDDGTESVYVDILDAVSSETKHPYTAMHALDLEEIDLSRRLGQRIRPSNPWLLDSLERLRVLDPKIAEQILASQGRLLREAKLAETQHNRLFKKWEELLSKEGLPAELPWNDILPETMRPRVAEAYLEYVEQYGQPPADMRDLLPLIGPLRKDRINVLGEYGMRVATDAHAFVELPSDLESESPEWFAMQQAQREAIEHVLGLLSETQARVIALHFGLDGDEPMDFKDIAPAIGVTHTRVRQILNKAMNKLSQPPYSTYIRDFALSEMHSQPNQTPKSKYDGVVEAIADRSTQKSFEIVQILKSYYEGKRRRLALMRDCETVFGLDFTSDDATAAKNLLYVETILQTKALKVSMRNAQAGYYGQLMALVNSAKYELSRVGLAGR